MKYAFALAAVAGLASASAHAGHQQFHRRDGVATVTDWTVVTVTDVVTMFGPSPSAKPSSAAASSPVASSPAAPVVSSSSSSSSSSAAAAVTTPVAAPTTPAAVPTTLQTVTSQAAKEQPAASSSSSAAAIPTTTAAAPAQTSSTPSTGDSGAGNYGMQPGASVAANCPKGTPCTGDMTTYDPSVGLGSCGYQDSQADDVVALQMNMFGTLSNSGANQPSNKLCNKKIQITNPKTGATAVGTIRDRCPGCTGPGGIDLSSTLMGKVNGGVADGRIPVEWYFLD